MSPPQPRSISKRALYSSLLIALAVSSLSSSPLQANIKLDRGFGNHGRVVSDLFGNDNDISDIAVQSDGKIVVVGSAQPAATDDFAITRYLANGALDNEFGIDGTVTVDFNNEENSAHDIEIQDDGKLVVVGSTFGGSTSDFAVARLQSDGDLDPTFGSGGKTTIDFSGRNDNAEGLAIDPNDGSMIIVGMTSQAPNSDIAIAKLDITGSLVPTFGSAGLVQTAVTGGFIYVTAVKIDSAARIYVAGLGQPSGWELVIARYNTTGILDTSFGDTSSGMLSRSFGGNTYISDLQLLNDGKILATGMLTPGISVSYIFLARFTTSGADDITFATNGVESVFIGELGSGTGLAVQPNGKILVGGYAFVENKGTQALLLRFNARGQQENSFSSFEIGNRYRDEYVTSMTRATDGSVLLVGSIDGGDTEDAFIYRLNGTSLVPLVKPTVYIGSRLPLRPIARYLEMRLPPGASVSAQVVATSRAICKIERGALRGLKRGRCVVRITVTRSDDTSVSRRVTLNTRRSFG